jgi:hypothetical protein
METKEHDFATIREAGGNLYAEFLAAGFREHLDRSGCKHTPYLLQKRIRDDNGTRYFINVWCYDNRNFDSARPFGVMPEVQFYDQNDEVACDVTMAGQVYNASHVERFFDHMHANMIYGYYERNEWQLSI